MGFYPFGPSAGAVVPTFAQSATYYVARTGSDSNSGLSWANAFATVQAAMNAIPVVNGVQVGNIEVGGGTFSSANTIVASSVQSVTINGRGSGQIYDSANNQLTPVYTTELHYTGSSDAIQLTGAANFGSGGAVTNTGIVISNLAITGTTADRYALNITKTESVRLENVNIDLHGVFGIRQSQVYGILIFSTYITRCGTAGAVTPTGGHFLDPSVGPNPGVNYLYGECAFNFGFGLYDGGSPTTSTGLVGTSSVFQNNAASAMAGSGVGVFSGGQSQWSGCDFEANALYGFYADNGGQHSFAGCDFLGDTVSSAGIYNGHLGGSVLAVYGCRFAGSTVRSIDNTSTNFISWGGCTSSDPQFIYNGSVANVVPADGFAPLVTGTTGAAITGWSPQILNAAGPVTANASWGLNNITLNANCTSFTVPVGPPGQFLDVVFVQGTGGTRLVTWAAAFRFAAGTTPVLSTAAGTSDGFRFYSDGTSWRQYPAAGVH